MTNSESIINISTGFFSGFIIIVGIIFFNSSPTFGVIVAASLAIEAWRLGSNSNIQTDIKTLKNVIRKNGRFMDKNKILDISKNFKNESLQLDIINWLNCCGEIEIPNFEKNIDEELEKWKCASHQNIIAFILPILTIILLLILVCVKFYYIDITIHQFPIHF